MDDYNDHTITPPLRFVIITQEFDEEKGATGEYVDTIGHVIYGETMDEIQGIIAAHRKADKFFDSSFLGMYDGIKLKNDVIGLI